MVVMRNDFKDRVFSDTHREFDEAYNKLCEAVYMERDYSVEKEELISVYKKNPLDLKPYYKDLDNDYETFYYDPEDDDEYEEIPYLDIMYQSLRILENIKKEN